MINQQSNRASLWQSFQICPLFWAVCLDRASVTGLLDGFKTKAFCHGSYTSDSRGCPHRRVSVNWEEFQVQGFSCIELAYVVCSLSRSSDFLIKLIILEVHVRVIISHSSSGLVSQHAVGSFHGSVWPWGRAGVPRVSQQSSCNWLVSTHRRVNQVYYNCYWERQQS